ncbi:E3 ubiquitin-protein ligase KCMF1 [Drosophila santomea]|uniref:E3 ubiquitin-protein ligase KCMF1 n=1 Tax=Drosophila santomea TaxID=129105 RepID=UPI001CCCB836|nr:E3 ubiquitin-protein ligase KCMF1 [Drosophila santomea]
MNRHERIECKGCGKQSFTFRCYRCLSCQDFDLCEGCYDNDFTTATHPFDHPVVCVLIPSDVELYFGGEYISNYPPQSYRCPYCKRWGFNESTFLEHVSAMHPDASPLLVSTMVGLFEQQQAARLFLESEQLASITVAATSRNELMRRPEGSMALYLEPLNRDGSYRRGVDTNGETRARRCSPDGRDRLQALVRDRNPRMTRRSAGPATRSSPMTSRPPPAPASRNNSSNNTQMDLNNDLVSMAARSRLNVIQDNVEAAAPFGVSGSATSQPQQQQQVVAPSPNAAAAPIATHPSLIEMMRFYDEAGLQPFAAPSGRAIRTRSANSAPPATSSGNNTRTIHVYGPTSAFTQAPHNPRSLTLAPELFSRDERQRSARMPSFQANPGALQRQGSSTRPLTTRSVEFSELPSEESDLPLILGTSSIENMLRCLNEDPAKAAKQRDQERRRFLCYRFVAPRTSKRPQNHFLLLRAEFVSQVLYSAFCDEDIQGVSFPILGNISKLRIIPGNVISGAGDAEKIPSPP